MFHDFWCVYVLDFSVFFKKKIKVSYSIQTYNILSFRIENDTLFLRIHNSLRFLKNYFKYFLRFWGTGKWIWFIVGKGIVTSEHFDYITQLYYSSVPIAKSAIWSRNRGSPALLSLGLTSPSINLYRTALLQIWRIFSSSKPTEYEKLSANNCCRQNIGSRKTRRKQLVEG